MLGYLLVGGIGLVSFTVGAIHSDLPSMLVGGLVASIMAYAIYLQKNKEEVLEE